MVNLASIAWRNGGGDFPADATAKAGIIGLTRSLARAFGPDNIRVNAIEPGAVMTERQRRLWHTSPAAGDAIVQRQSLRRTLLEEEIARAVLFLAADDRPDGYTLAQIHTGVFRAALMAEKPAYDVMNGATACRRSISTLPLTPPPRASRTRSSARICAASACWRARAAKPVAACAAIAAGGSAGRAAR